MVIGIDYDTHAIYLCAYEHGHDPILAGASLRSTKGSDATEAIKAVPSALFRCLMEIKNTLERQERGTVHGVEAWIERGRGANRNVDWILGAVAGAVISHYGAQNGASIRLLDANQWKAHVGARGNTKAAANHACTLQWMSRHPGQTPPTDPNLLDAYGIALTASTR